MFLNNYWLPHWVRGFFIGLGKEQKTHVFIEGTELLRLRTIPNQVSLDIESSILKLDTEPSEIYL